MTAGAALLRCSWGVRKYSRHDSQEATADPSFPSGPKVQTGPQDDSPHQAGSLHLGETPLQLAAVAARSSSCPDTNHSPHYLRVPSSPEILVMLPRLFHAERKKDSPRRVLFHWTSGSAGTSATQPVLLLVIASAAAPRCAAIHRSRIAPAGSRPIPQNGHVTLLSSLTTKLTPAESTACHTPNPRGVGGPPPLRLP